MRTGATVSLSIGLFVFSGVASAADSPKVEAERHYRAGIELTIAKKWQEALAEYRTAQAIVESRLAKEDQERILPAILSEIGLAAENIPGAEAVAIDAYERYLEHPPKKANPEAVKNAKAFVGRAGSRVGRIAITGPDGARVSIDTEPRGVLPLARALPVIPGEHVIELSAERWVPGAWRTAVTAAAGKREAVEAPARGTFRVESKTPSVRILVDGVEAPAVSELVVGSHEIKVVREGHEPFAQTLTIKAGDNPPLAVALAALGEGSGPKIDQVPQPAGPSEPKLVETEATKTETSVAAPSKGVRWGWLVAGVVAAGGGVVLDNVLVSAHSPPTKDAGPLILDVVPLVLYGAGAVMAAYGIWPVF